MHTPALERSEGTDQPSRAHPPAEAVRRAGAATAGVGLPARSCPAPEADLTPAERLREIAAILVAGLLRLGTRPEATPESATFGRKSSAGELSDSAKE
jgi:hypothetical protein